MFELVIAALRNMIGKDQHQEVAVGSSAIQAGRDIAITNVGLTYAEARQVALDVFRANFFQLAGEAKEVARARAEEVTEEFLSKLEMENPSGLGKAQDPDFQYALFTVQREFARTGDKDLGDLLVDLLVDRSKQQQRDILQIVLNESLGTAPKLTEAQLAVLAVVFLFKYTQNFGIGNHAMLGTFLDKHVEPFVDKLVKNDASYQHLQFSGCGSIGLGSIALEDILSKIYQGLFVKGFDPTDVEVQQISIGRDERVFMPCLNDPAKFQVRANSHETLDKLLDSLNVPAEDRTRIKALFDQNKMSHEEVKNKIIEIRPFMIDVFKTWSESPMKNFTLTSVGIAIGHANIKRLVGEFADLSIWIN